MSSFLHFVNNKLLKLQWESEEGRRLNVHRVENISDPLLQQADMWESLFYLFIRFGAEIMWTWLGSCGLEWKQNSGWRFHFHFLSLDMQKWDDWKKYKLNYLFFLGYNLITSKSFVP